MPRQDLIQIRRGTRAAFNALTSGNKLEAGELGAATDTMELLVGLGPTTDPFVVGSGGGGGGASFFTQGPLLSGANTNGNRHSYRGGDQTGNALGPAALDIQTWRSNANQVAAGENCIAIGNRNRAGNPDSSAAVVVGLSNSIDVEGICYGFDNSLTGLFGSSMAIGWSNSISDNSVAVGASITSATGFNSVLLGRLISHTGTPSANEGNVLVGYQITANGAYVMGFGNGLNLTGSFSTVVGWACTNSASGAVVLGQFCSNSGESSLCLGTVVNTINSTLNVQMGAARIRGYNNTGQLALSIQNRATAYTATATDEGSEPENTLRPSMFAIRRNGMQFIIDINDAGTIRSLVLGTAT